MPGWGWVLVAVGGLVVAALVIWQGLKERRTRMLQGRFGPEYDRTLESAESKRDAEAELRARADRRDALEIVPLTTAARERYAVEWLRVQAKFVDDPEGALRDADLTIQSVMADRGYPMDDFEQRAADLSVDHPQVVENYSPGAPADPRERARRRHDGRASPGDAALSTPLRGAGRRDRGRPARARSGARARGRPAVDGLIWDPTRSRVGSQNWTNGVVRRLQAHLGSENGIQRNQEAA